MKALLDWVAAGRQRSVWIPVTLVVGIGYCDFLTGYLLSLSFIYIVPVLTAVWARGIGFGIAVAALGSVVSVTASYAGGLPMPNVFYAIWNDAMRFAVFATVAYLVGSMRLMLERESREALSDPLTRVGNRRALLRALDAESNRVGHSGRCFSLVFIDVDDFKKLNDSAGHAIGDKALTAIAAALAGSARVMDVSARMGGDEFCVLLPATDEVTLRTVVARLRATAEAAIAAQGWPISLSIGAVTVRNAGLSAIDVLEAADAAMYAAKTAGKNQVCYRVLH